MLIYSSILPPSIFSLILLQKSTLRIFYALSFSGIFRFRMCKEIRENRVQPSFEYMKVC